MSRRRRDEVEASPVLEATKEPLLLGFRLRLLRSVGIGSARRTARRIQGDVKAAEAAVELMGVVARSEVTVRAARTRNAGPVASRVVVVYSGSAGEASLLHASSLSRVSIAWDGEGCIVVTGHDGRAASWSVLREGVGSRYRAEIIAATGRRPRFVDVHDEAVAEVALVGTGLGDVLFLDQCSRVLAEIPAEGFTIRQFQVIAEAAGVPFASYRLTGRRRQTRGVVEALFPRSDHYRRVR